MRRVVITGLGAMTSAGEGSQALWEAVTSKKSGIKPVFLDGGEAVALAATIENFEPEKYVTQRKSLKVMARDIQLAVAAASLAMGEAGIKTGSFDPDRFGVIVGSGVFNHEIEELSYSVANSLDSNQNLDLQKFGSEGLGSLFPLWLLKYLPNMPACHISILFDLRGMNNTITTGASGGLQAVGEAFRIIERGAADLMLAGAAESKVNPVGLSEYQLLGASSDSFAVGEGAGFVVLEELEHAQKRGAKIYAEVIGFGSSYQQGHFFSMNAALKDAKLSPEKISYIQASGIGIAREDQEENKAMKQVFGDAFSSIRVEKSKSVIGFTGFASGILDLIISTLALKNKKETASVSAMTNAFGFNGQTATVVTRG